MRQFKRKSNKKRSRAWRWGKPESFKFLLLHKGGVIKKSKTCGPSRILGLTVDTNISLIQKAISAWWCLLSKTKDSHISYVVDFREIYREAKGLSKMMMHVLNIFVL